MSRRGRGVLLAHPLASRRPLEEFPAVRLPGGWELWRCHRVGREPWWFSWDGRFALTAPAGTCYLADDPLIGVLEVLSHGTVDGMVVSEAFLAERRIRRLPLPAPARFADATDGRGRGFGVTREIHDVPDYSLPQAWAAAWRAHAFHGVRYLATSYQPPAGAPPWRGPGAQGPGAWALFGQAGERRRWRRGRPERIGAELRRRLELEAGVQVAPVPDLDQLDTAAPGESG